MLEDRDAVAIGPLPEWVPTASERLLGRRGRLDRPWGAMRASWFMQTVLVADRAPGLPDAHEVLTELENEPVRVWALTELYRHRIDPGAVTLRVVHTAAELIPDDEWGRLELAEDCVPEPDPVFEALDAVTDAQRWLQKAEVERVTAAVAAWRAALEQEADPLASNTPYQRGFFTDLAAKLKVAATTAKVLVHAADALETATPKVWRYFLDGLTTWRAMQLFHQHLDGLDPQLHARFDAEAVRKVVEVTPTGLPDALRRLCERLQASTADERHDAAAARRHVTVEPVGDGMAWLHAYLPAVDALALDHQLIGAAVHAKGRAGETRGIAQLKADVLIDGLRQALRSPRKAAKGLLVAGRRGVQPQVCVTIPALTALGHSQAPATLEGYGTIGIKTALKLASGAKAWVRVLTDPITGGVLDLARTRYRPSKDLRVLIRMLDGATRGPSTPRPPGQGQIDHVVSYNKDGAGGSTEPGNLALLSVPDHTGKTDGAGDYDLMRDRTVLWKTCTGGTIITRPAEPLEATPVPRELIDPDDCPF